MKVGEDLNKLDERSIVVMLCDAEKTTPSISHASTEILFPERSSDWSACDLAAPLSIGMAVGAVSLL